MNCDIYKEELERLAESGMLRQIPQIDGQSKWVEMEGRQLLNLSSNDYLGLFGREDLREEFFAQFQGAMPHLSSASSRLLTGNNRVSEELEELLARSYKKESALIFNSGYHVNSGLIAALTHSGSFIIADKLVHASIIDGIKLSGSPFARYSHNDMEHLERILKREHNAYSQIIIATEGIFSMGGDKGKIEEMVRLKSKYPNVLLYVDEAHSFGVCGEGGLGLCEELGVMADVDIIVGTFGKAISSVGAYALLPKVVREYLVNKMRPLIFSTSLPPLNIEWSRFVISRLGEFSEQRERLRRVSQILRERLGVEDSDSQIIGYTVGEASRALSLSKELMRRGFYALPVRPPTVPQGQSGVRFSLTAAISEAEVERLCSTIKEILEDEII